MALQQSEDFLEALGLILNNEQLDEQIQKQTDLGVLELMLDIKLKRHKEGTCGLIKSSLFHRIFDEKCDNTILKKIIMVSEDSKSLLHCLAAMFNKQCLEVTNNMRLLEILHVLLSFEDKSVVNSINISVLNNFLLNILCSRVVSCKTYLLSEVLPLYFCKISIQTQVLFLNQIFTKCLDLKNLESLCSIYSSIEQTVIVEETSVIHQENFWNFLAECLFSSNSFLHKQATYILEKSVNLVYEKNINNTFVNTEAGSDTKKVWGDFFILLDISREKQLHLIKPSLPLLVSVRFLHILWQKCLYKILLNHSQHSIVYFVASYLLQNCDQKMTKDTISLILPAINKNEYSSQSNRMFEHFKIFCLKLNQDQFDFLLDQMLLVSWNPASLWCVFKNLFVTENRNVVTTVYYFKEIIYLVKNLPHICIRDACESKFTDYFVNSFIPKTLTEIYNVVLMINKTNIRIAFLKKIKQNVKISDSEVYMLLKEHRENYNNSKQVIYVLRALNRLGDDELSQILNNVMYVDPILKITYQLESHSLADIQHFLIGTMPKDLTESNIDGYKEMLLYCNFKENSGVVHNLIFKMLKNTNISKLEADLCFEFLSNCVLNHVTPIKNILTKWKSFILNNKTDDRLCNLYINIYFKVYCKDLDSKKSNEIIEMLSVLLDSQGNKVIENIYRKLSELISNSKEPDLILKFIDRCFENLNSYTKMKCFQQISLFFIQTFFSIYYFQSVNYNLVKISAICNKLLIIYENYHSIRLNMAMAINALVTDSEFKAESLQILAPFVIELFLQGIIIKSDERVENNICNDIFKETKDLGVSFHGSYAQTRVHCMKSILFMLWKNEDIVEVFVSYLIRKYAEHFKKRYFPDSQIHIQKLRILQLVLMISPYFKSKNHLKTKITHLITNSFQEEIHQNCVRQLMQWLLILILSQSNTQDANIGIGLIKNVVNISVKTQPSSVTALIPVLYHVTLARPHHLKETIDVLAPWSMGAQFKLRVYSQIAIKKLIEKLANVEANQYDLIKKSVDSCIEASGVAFYDTLKTDKQFFDVFDPDRDLSLETIFRDIPRLNRVTPFEWESISFVLFDECISVIPAKNKSRTFSESIDNVKNDGDQNPLGDITFIDIDSTHCSTIVQKKITPWRSNMDTTDVTSISDFILITSLLDKPQNLGGLMRTCEVFGVKQLVLHDAKITSDKEFKSLSMSSEKLIDIVEVKINDLKEFMVKLKKDGYCVVGAEQTSESVKLNDFQFRKKTAVLLGNEKEGIPPNLIPLLDSCLEIPQFGYVRSLNVHVAGAMFIWEYAKQHLLV